MTLTHNKVSKSYLLHRLLAIVFIPNPLNKPHINHKDGNKRNFELSNLEWVTPSENTQHAVNTGLLSVGLGESSHNRKLSEDKVHKIVEMYKSGRFSVAQISAQFDVTDSTVDAVIKGRTWKHLNLVDEPVISKQPTSSNAAKLTEDKVREIRRLHSTGQYTHQQLGDMFNVVRKNISQIVNYKTWKHVV